MTQELTTCWCKYWTRTRIWQMENGRIWKMWIGQANVDNEQFCACMAEWVFARYRNTCGSLARTSRPMFVCVHAFIHLKNIGWYWRCSSTCSFRFVLFSCQSWRKPEQTGYTLCILYRITKWSGWFVCIYFVLTWCCTSISKPSRVKSLSIHLHDVPHCSMVVTRASRCVPTTVCPSVCVSCA